MRSHTGGAVLSFGRGAIMNKSSKQKINTKSSTESDLVGASDYITPHMDGAIFESTRQPNRNVNRAERQKILRPKNKTY
eukprot:scaffold233_cov198-Chaetoceros_neogracile.AAC.12